MKIIEIQALENGAHRNQSNASVVPVGWAVIPATLDTPSFPFGTLTADEIDGVMTVTSWTAGELPPPEPEPEPDPTPQEDTDAMLVDHELRITMLELFGTEE